jgi:hypothetical protein
MKIIHKDGFPAEERNSYKSIIYNNVVSAMRVLVNAANDLGIAITRKVDNITITQLTPSGYCR